MPYLLVVAMATFATAVAAAEPGARAGLDRSHASTAAVATSAEGAVASPNPQVATAMQLAKAALDRVVAIYQVDPAKVRNLVKGSQGFAVLENLVKVGFIDAQIHGQGFLVYRLKSGRWGPPLMLEVYGTSVGPQIGMRVTDVLIVFKTKKSMQDLLTGRFLNGMVTPGGSYVYGSTDTSNLPTGIVTYSLHRGLMLGQSVDEYHIRLLDQANLRLYGKPLKSGDIVDIEQVGLRTPAPVEMFVDQLNTELGEPAHQTDWKTGGPMPQR
ncbi:MAG: lipid-binding SYLF domain-containing protein [Thiobacillaceae bacterium]